MVKLTIDGRNVEIAGGSTILAAAEKLGIQIPTLCYMKGINEIAACRVCVVEVAGLSRLTPACATAVSDGMSVRTNSPRVRASRKTNVQLMLSQHDCMCPACIRSGNCGLQELAGDLGLYRLDYGRDVPENDWDRGFPLQKRESKCIKCMRCVQVCAKTQSLGIWDAVGSGGRASVNVSGNRAMAESNCSLCGQCITHCPVGSLGERDDTEKVFKALADPKVVTVAQIAPAVRAAWAEYFGLGRESATPGLMVAALKKIGFDYVFDTSLSADMTVMEEASEFIKGFMGGDPGPYPLFTSCCPGWVRFIKTEFPRMVPYLSTAKSPQQMFGAIIKTYFAERNGIDPNSIFQIAIMPCIAKKHECDLPTMDSSGAGRDVDVVLTTREFVRMLREEHIDVTLFKELGFDDPLGESTGAGVIFGATGGVMEAALRTAYCLATGDKPPVDTFRTIRGMNGWKEATFDVSGRELKVAVASGLGNARKLMDAIVSGEVRYHFVEVMACPGGCGGGGGQPINRNAGNEAQERENTLYNLDELSKYRFSHENPAIIRIYDEFLGEPLSPVAKRYLHTVHRA
ncbi:MAG: [FeFe] hydrogenase, group A [Oscillospiraceae bacterium]|nr:[FeFe] hydrogenase, group A [Oscillospiraceae bacterium]